MKKDIAIIKNLTDIKTRHDLPFFLNKNNLLNKGVELGVLRGEFSKYILNHWKGKILYSIDHWLRSNRHGTINNSHGERKYKITQKRLAKFKDRSIILKKTSKEARKLFEDNSLDFVYIDADHTEKYVSKDIKYWWPKIKTNGILCGDDYIQRRDYGVIPAVNTFVEKYNLTLHVDEPTGEVKGRGSSASCSPSWYVSK